MNTMPWILCVASDTLALCTVDWCKTLPRIATNKHRRFKFHGVNFLKLTSRTLQVPLMLHGWALPIYSLTLDIGYGVLTGLCPNIWNRE
ncbi:uncharacterized protein HD556DRAFT_1398875 [Suillus plorans]|uniref:Secreted protein n=1 Tax=Suillus plorans TaxID=116603 RepID=A0A9P7AIW5_9AGAM|nr:uncharacterized protein HD556DRAFT_1398875 [Suillus plorans]KAG1789287.1 hypothetical protein HD556DRAFT_1398875 [Suillus plorans]